MSYPCQLFFMSGLLAVFVSCVAHIPNVFASEAIQSLNYEVDEAETGDVSIPFETPNKSKLLEEDASIDDLDVDRDLGYTSEETRNFFTKGASLTLGSTRPWQFYSFSLTTVASGRSFWVWNVGGGNYEFRGEHSDLPYEIQISSKSFDVAKKWFLTPSMPVYVAAGLGAAFWNGRIDPQGTVLNKEQPIADKLSSGFSANGLYLFTGIGVSVIKRSGFYLDYNILGLGTSTLISSTFTNDTSEVSGVLKKNVGKGQTWGFSNISIGMFFR